MGEVLSQNEIDSLLAALSTGELDTDKITQQDEKQVKNYDFARPAKFSKEHLRTLEFIYEHYGRLLSTTLPVYLRKHVQVSVVSSETVVFSEFSNALINPVILGVVNFHPLPGSIIIDMASNLGFAMIDRMLGGQGVPLKKGRDFSEIELTIIDKIVTICMQLMKEPWRNVVEIEPFLEKVETNPQFAQIISPTDMIAIVTLNIKIGDVEGLMNICLPFFTLENVMDKLNTKYWFSTIKDSSDEDFEYYVESMIRKVSVPLKVQLGTNTITVSDFTNLQCGDIIRLNTKTDSELSVFVGNIKKFTALPGTSDDKYAVRVTSVIREEE
ncbi:MAG: flagellar motor switch protein FliM [Lachnospiraceae bacterium]|nr:flagellar motor switch protein FliM [Lachnospiraceae bacterium]MDD7026917.1 flagellar motor switch protein FliM [Lachnospiraceae bacterium]MDY5701020.1 flagellar motor switch protein FliM [Lachnospiraceae bacterium]